MARASVWQPTTSELRSLTYFDSAMSGPLSQTMLAHRLMAKAQIVGGTEAQLKLLQAIFSAYHEQELDIGSEDVLAELAEEQGILSRDEVRVV